MPATRTRRAAAAADKPDTNADADEATEGAQDANTGESADGETADNSATGDTPQIEGQTKEESEGKDITIDINVKEGEADKAAVKGEDIEEALKNADEIPEEADNSAKDAGEDSAVKAEGSNDVKVKQEETGDAGENTKEAAAASGSGNNKGSEDQSGNTDKGETETADGGTEAQADSAADQDGKPSEPAVKQEKPKEEEEEEDEDQTVPYPESFSKLHQLTVNIGPIKQRDLMSKELHSILNLTWDFEIKFEKKEKKDESDSKGPSKNERLGSVRIPFTVNSPRFLINIARKLGNLRIDGRDMSVKFPEVFNSAVKDCEEYLNKVNRLNAKQRIKRVEKMKRQIIVKNVPEKVEEDTIKSMFPEACNVTLNMVDTDDGDKKVRSVLLDFETEKACKEFLVSNKDVTIGDCRVKLVWQYEDGRGLRSVTTASHKAARGRARGQGFRGRGRGKARDLGSQFGPRGQLNKKKGILDARPTNLVVSHVKGRMNVQVKRGGRMNRGGRASNAGPPPPRSQSPSRQSRSSFSPGSQKGPGNQGPSRSRQGFQGRRSRGGGGGGGGSQGFSPRNQSQGRRQEQHRGGRMDQPGGNRGGQQEDDPVAMMNFLKSAMARVEEKISQRSDMSDNYGYGGGHSSRDGGHGSQGMNQGRRQRKRKISRGEQGGGQGGKRQYQQGGRFSDRGMDNSGRHSGRSSLDNSFNSRNTSYGGGGGFNRDSGNNFYDNRDNYIDNYSGQQQMQSSNMMGQGQGNYYGQGQMNFGNRSATQGSGSYGYNNNNNW